MHHVPYLQNHPQNHTYGSESWNWLSNAFLNPLGEVTTRWGYLRDNPGGTPLTWDTAAVWMDNAVGNHNASHPYQPPKCQQHYIEIDSNNGDYYGDTLLSYLRDPHGYPYIVRGLASALRHLQNAAAPLVVWRYAVSYDGHANNPGVLTVSRLP